MTFPKPSGDFEWVQASWGAALRCAPLAAVARHCFSTRDLRLEGVRDDDRPDWIALARALGVNDDRLVRMRQVHGARVFAANSWAMPGLRYDDWPEGDIAISRDSSLALSVRSADCVPVLLGDRRTGAVAAVHAGWKGTAGGAVMEAVGALAQNFGSAPADLIAAVGPSIGPCCYVVGNELAAHFTAYPDAADWFVSGLKPRMNLWQATRDQLARAGVPGSQIHVCELCTFDYPALFHSYRRDGQAAGRLVAAIRSVPDTTP